MAILVLAVVGASTADPMPRHHASRLRDDAHLDVAIVIPFGAACIDYRPGGLVGQ
jgi:hypothetical protein